MTQEAPTDDARNGTAAPVTSKPDDTAQTFSRAYVEELRQEAKDNRLKAQRADWWATEARRLALREATRGVLAAPEALAWDDAWTTEDGIDHAAIRAAAEDLAQTSPWLARPRGPLPGQGEHGTPAQPLSLSTLLRG